MSKILVKGVYESSPTDVVNKNDVDLHLSPKGYVIVVNSDGSPVGGTTAYVEDTPSAGGESMIIAGVVRQDTLASSTTTDGDYAYMKVDSTGRLYVNAQGGVASGVASTGNPITTGGRAATTNPTAVSNGQVVNAMRDKLGKQVVVGAVRDLKGSQKTTITSSTSETTIITAVASTFLDLYELVIANTSASACNVTIKDATAGTTRFIIAVPAGDTRGFSLPAGDGHKQATVNNNWTATCSASVASIEITALFVQNT